MAQTRKVDEVQAAMGAAASYMAVAVHDDGEHGV